MFNFISKLTSICWLRAYGTDTQTFLHGQLSNDLQSLDSAHLQFHAYCNPKGRMLSLLEVQRFGDDFLLQLPCELQDTLLHRLRMYILRADVKIEPQPYETIGIIGDKAQTTLAKFIGELPTHPQALVVHKRVTITKQHGNSVPRYQLYGEPDDIGPLWRALSERIKVAAESVWWHQSIIAGIPRIVSATSEAFIPQMVNLDLLQGISFQKGCYPGQEIIARLRYLGTLKQRMQRTHGKDVAKIPEPGDKITADKHNVGTIVDAQPDGLGGWDALAVLQLDLPENTPLTSANGALMSVHPLPYPLLAADQKQT